MPETLRRTSTKKKKKHDTTPQTPLFVGLVAAVVGAVWYLRKRATQNQGTTKPSTTRSAFKFPEPTKQSGLPRNSKSSNNKKKNKAKKRAEKAQKKAEKEKVSTSKGKGKQEDGQASTSVINYTYFDTARRDTVIPTHKKPSLSAADVMKKDQDLKK